MKTRTSSADPFRRHTAFISDYELGSRCTVGASCLQRVPAGKSGIFPPLPRLSISLCRNNAQARSSLAWLQRVHIICLLNPAKRETKATASLEVHARQLKAFASGCGQCQLQASVIFRPFSVCILVFCCWLHDPSLQVLQVKLEEC